MRHAALVASHRSAADGRDTYYALDLERLGTELAAVGGGLHAGLRSAPRQPRHGAPIKVLFLCTGNSARSQIAAALATMRSGGRIDARSAGSDPRPLHPQAITVLREMYGLDIAGRRSAHVSAYDGEPFDRVITLCDKVREVCHAFGRPESAHWSIPDPAAINTSETFKQTAIALDTRIRFLIADLVNDPQPQEDT
jgi:ArsR family transcriptional regulator, arsenate/arsenite/antimonite-responsive transcriptional repressor / arsenate reductase (thioredoxin)